MSISAKPKSFSLRNPVHLLASGFGSGCLPRAPGTWGTLAAVPCYWLAQHLVLPYYLILLVIMAAAGVWLCGRTADDLQVHDHPGIVWDEFVGYFITMIAAPEGWIWIVIGFVLFRLFDILKPWPIGRMDESLRGGFGIMADDVLAGCYAWLILQGIAYFWGL